MASTGATSLSFAPALLVAGLGMGAIFAPLVTMAMRAAPPALAGAASGVLNTGRQLGGTLGGAVTGAVLASQLAAAMQARSARDASALPPAARPAFAAALARSARAGLQVGRGQPVARVPAGTRPSLIGQLEHLYKDVFAHGYITAMGPTLAIPVALLLVGAAACLLLRRHPAPPPGGEAAAGTQARAVPVGTADQ